MTDLTTLRTTVCNELFGVRCAFALFNDRATFDGCVELVREGLTIASIQDFDGMPADELFMLASMLSYQTWEEKLVQPLADGISRIFPKAFEYAKKARVSADKSTCTASHAVQITQTREKTAGYLDELKIKLQTLGDTVRGYADKAQQMRMEGIVKSSEYRGVAARYYISAVEFDETAQEYTDTINALHALKVVLPTDMIVEAGQMLIKGTTVVSSARAFIM